MLRPFASGVSRPGMARTAPRAGGEVKRFLRNAAWPRVARTGKEEVLSTDDAVDTDEKKKSLTCHLRHLWIT
jgi:hypothetical protein